MSTHAGLGALLLFAAAAGGGPGVPGGPTVEGRFGWLAGCWSGGRGQTTFREVWTVGSPDLMVGLSVTNRPSRPAEFEYLRIEARPGGGAAYVAQPGGAPPTAFVLDEAASRAERAVFANPAHDFPRRITYQRLEGGGLLAAIDEGGPGRKRIEFPMERSACPGGSPARSG